MKYLVIIIFLTSCNTLKERKKQRILRKFNNEFIIDTIENKRTLKGFDTIFNYSVNKEIDTFVMNVKNVNSKTILNLQDSTIFQYLTVRDTFFTEQILQVKERPKPIIDKVFKVLTLLLFCIVVLLFLKLFFVNK